MSSAVRALHPCVLLTGCFLGSNNLFQVFTLPQQVSWAKIPFLLITSFWGMDKLGTVKFTGMAVRRTTDI